MIAGAGFLHNTASASIVGPVILVIFGLLMFVLTGFGSFIVIKAG